MAAFAVPESARTARDALREMLVHLGGAELTPAQEPSTAHLNRPSRLA
ncbi:hypothetical protein [Nonomuraea sp. WAC 01424]